MAVLYVCWVLVNLALLVGLVFGWYRCLRRFPSPYSRATGLVICLVTVAMCSSSTKQAPVRLSAYTAIAVTPAFAPKRSVVLTGRLLDWPTTQLTQLVSLNPPTQPGDSVRVQQSVLLTGLQLGLRWEPTYLAVRPRPDRRLHYDVIGTLNWQLLNMTIYKQPLQYTGDFDPATQPSW